jgi:hypothetical protein
MSSLDLLLKQIDDPSDLSWKDETYDLALAAGLSDAERTAFVSRLIDAARQDDPRAVLTLGYIHADEVLPALLPLAKANNPMAATARRAVVLLGHGGQVVDEIARDAVHAAAKMERVGAVMDLAKVGGPKAIDALAEALADSEYEIRELAWQGLVTVFDLDKRLRSPEGKRELVTHVELLSVWLGSQLSSLMNMGVAGMRELVAKLRAGASPGSLGIKWIANPAPQTFQQIRMALFDPEAAYPIDEIKSLTGSSRQWAETMILLRLEHGDTRVPDAMVRLGAEWTVPVLDEVAKSASTPSELRDALTESIRSLQAS